MDNIFANSWRALRDRFSSPRRAEAARRLADLMRLLEGQLARERDEVDKLRGEIEGLRLDNRALLNSLLGTCGVPPLEVPRTGDEAPPLRRPSWRQIAAKREIEAARHARKQHDEKH